MDLDAVSAGTENNDFANDAFLLNGFHRGCAVDGRLRGVRGMVVDLVSGRLGLWGLGEGRQRIVGGVRWPDDLGAFFEHGGAPFKEAFHWLGFLLKLPRGGEPSPQRSFVLPIG